MSVGAGMLDAVFAGEKGVAATLTKSMGGTATLIRQISQEEYDDQTGETIPAEFEQQSIAFVQETLGKFIQSGVGGTQVVAGNLIGLVAASDLNFKIANNVDKIVWQYKTWLITSQEDIMSGNQVAMVRFLAQ